MATQAVLAWYEAMRTLERRAKDVRRKRHPKAQTSRRAAARALARPPYKVELNARLISAWLPDDPNAAHVPRFSDPEVTEKVWALIRLWSDWAGAPGPDRTYWMDLLEAAQPTRGRPARGRERATRSTGIPAQLPGVPADFTGRIRELAEVKARCGERRPVDGVNSPALLVITGLAGVGKSALSLRLAHDLAPEYPDGQLYCRLRADEGTLDEGLVLARFLRALGAPGDMPEDTASRAALFRELLLGRRMLILLDDATDASQVRSLLPADGGCLVVVTSRNALPALEGAQGYDLGLLDERECVSLLSKIVGADRIGADEAAARSIVEVCGRLPLALRIAAARLRARADWTPGHLASHLWDARRRLHHLKVGDLDVRAAFELSYRALDADAARLFRSLAARPGPTFALGLAARLLDVPESEAEEVVDRLVLDHLVEPAGAPGRFLMHDLVWFFALELLDDSGPDGPSQAMARSFGWYSDHLLAALTGLGIREGLWGEPESRPAPAEALSWLDAEEPNLYGLLGLIDHHGLDAATAELAYPLSLLAEQRGVGEVAEWILEIGTAAARRAGRNSELALLLFEKGDRWIDERPPSPDDAIACWREALSLLAPGPPGVVGALHARLADAYRDLGRITDAERESAAAQAALAAMDPEAGQFAAAAYQAKQLLDAGLSQKVIDLLEPLVPSLEGFVDPEKELSLRRPLGEAYLARSNHRAAQEQFSACLEICEERGLHSYRASILLGLGTAFYAGGQSLRALDTWNEGLEAAREADLPGMAARLSHALALHRYNQRDYAAACELFAAAAEHFAAASQPFSLAGALSRLGVSHAADGDVKAAAIAFDRAFDVLNRASDQARAEKNRRALHQMRRLCLKGVRLPLGSPVTAALY
ncbi:NB-ARC domain-containing protein [Actinomadura sp. NPDC048032]|uniref:NB-ARC domain-containing protein n=1 Tax=Actinomadura sp. NPDC048032 TaxID=3155747 RepID=UPI0033F3EC49